MDYTDLTPQQQNAVDQWMAENDPDGYSFDCADNHRYAVVGNQEQVDRYYELQSNGCCGFVDVELEVDGQTLLFGFNYGH